MKRKEDNGRKRDGQCSVWVPLMSLKSSLKS